MGRKKERFDNLEKKTRGKKNQQPAPKKQQKEEETIKTITLPEKMTMTPEDAATYSSRITDISTLVQENTQKFILGARDLSEFDAYVEDVKALNIEDLIQFQQAAYDRYKNR